MLAATSWPRCFGYGPPVAPFSRWFRYLTQFRISSLNVLEPSDRSVSNHPLPSQKYGLKFSSGLTAMPPNEQHTPFQWVGADIGLRHFVASSPRQQAESSLLPTDRSFTSGCFPPRLSATQLPSITRSRPNLDRDSHPANSKRS